MNRKLLKSMTRDKILASGLDLMSEAGLEGVTLGLLASRVGMSKSGLFAHFGSKEEVQLALLEQTADKAQTQVVGPAMAMPEGLPRLESLFRHWLGWTQGAGLPGGCPVAAGLFEYDDCEGPVRERLLVLEQEWRGLLSDLVTQAVAKGDLRADLDHAQFVWELGGIYLAHHVSLRFMRDAEADSRAMTAFAALLERAGRQSTTGRAARKPRQAKQAKS